MENKEEKCYFLGNIKFLCNIDSNAKITIVPFVYNLSKTSVKNLLTNEIGKLGEPSSDKDVDVAKALNISSYYCEILSSNYVLEEIIDATSRVKLPKELKACTYWFSEHFSFEVDEKKLAEYVITGASTRAGIAFMECSKAVALLNGRDYVTPDDVKSLKYSVLRHRISLSFAAMADNVKVEAIIDAIFEAIRTP